jgi:hypothetical protein
VEILLRNGANIDEKDVKNISVGKTDDFEKEREREREQREKERESRERKREKEREGAERGSRERG